MTNKNELTVWMTHGWNLKLGEQNHFSPSVLSVDEILLNAPLYSLPDLSPSRRRPRRSPRRG